MFRFLKRDNTLLGILVGIVVPSLVFALAYGINLIAMNALDKETGVPIYTLFIVAIFSNMFLIRYYLVRMKYDNTGRGMLLVTFIAAIVFFFFYLKSGGQL